MSWRLAYTKQARFDSKQLSRSNLRSFCFRRINVKHRLVYQVQEKERVVKVVRTWAHYEWPVTSTQITTMIEAPREHCFDLASSIDVHVTGGD